MFDIILRNLFENSRIFSYNKDGCEIMNLYDLTIEELEDYFVGIGDKKYRATQVYEWLYRKRIHAISEMTNLKKELLAHLEEKFTLHTISLVEQQEDVDVRKFLFRLMDGEVVEAVLMRHVYGNSVCVSSQVGCNMGCKFCESGRRKKVRNLKTHEMVEQILLIEEIVGVRISHVVVMGIGEPFDNYENLVSFLHIINYAKGLAIGSRHITVSTCGIIPKIQEFMHLPYQVNLAISLHAPNNQIRDAIMPINKVYKLEDLIKILKEYIAFTNRRVTFEYVLLKGVNDSSLCAEELSNLLHGMNCYVNLIPYNETSHIAFERSDEISIHNFQDTLKKRGINVTIRKEYGGKISAACGQLRSKKEGYE